MVKNKQETTNCVCECGHSFYEIDTKGQVRIKRPLNIVREKKILCGGCTLGIKDAPDVVRFFHAVDLE